MNFMGLITTVTVADYKVNLEHQAISTTTIVAIDSGMQVQLMEATILDLGKVVRSVNLGINQLRQGQDTTTVVTPQEDYLGPFKEVAQSLDIVIITTNKVQRH